MAWLSYWTKDAFAAGNDQSADEPKVVLGVRPGDRAYNLVPINAGVAYAQDLEINTHRGFFVGWATSLVDSSNDSGTMRMFLMLSENNHEGVDIATMNGAGAVGTRNMFFRGSGVLRARILGSTKVGLLVVSVL